MRPRQDKCRGIHSHWDYTPTHHAARLFYYIIHSEDDDDKAHPESGVRDKEWLNQIGTQNKQKKTLHMVRLS